LGDGTQTTSFQPVPITGLESVVAIAAGDAHSLALKSDGTVWMWGDNGVNTSSTTPVQVTGLAGITSLAAGTHFAFAVKTDGMPSGTLWGWGANQFGVLGDGTWTPRATPTAVLDDVVSATAGDFNSVAMTESGTLLSWGINGSGENGDGTTNARSLPGPVSSLTGVTGAATGWHHSLAVHSDGHVSSWGYNGWGSLGDGTGTTSLTPVTANVVDALAVSTRAGSYHSAAVRLDGTLWTWGKNDVGALGDGTTATNAVPKAVPNFTLFFDDVDRDGLDATREAQLGTDPTKADTNGDGIPDGAAVQTGLSATNSDMDGDGVSNEDERDAGTNPFVSDTDGDTVSDMTDCMPLDSTRSTCSADPNDHTAPTITLDEPSGAVPVP
jgi:alpha-tubulin suppressor-like RCC1 family protein